MDILDIVTLTRGGGGGGGAPPLADYYTSKQNV